jgi:phosphoribosyl-AMP cyclohydrolase
MKGEESGNTQLVKEIRVDCDADALLYVVDSETPVCHTGNRSCFHNKLLDGRKLSEAT